MADFKPIDIATFWSRVDGSNPFQCWPWNGQKNDSGYGRFRGTMAHRVAYALVNGPIPEGLIVRHRCDNPPCCNPNHLLAGTNQDNSDDAVERGQIANGERHPKTKLTDDQVFYIRQNPDHLKLADLAARFDVCKATISYIRSGRSWKGLVGAVGIAPTTSAVSGRRSPTELSTPVTPPPIDDAETPIRKGT